MGFDFSATPGYAFSEDRLDGLHIGSFALGDERGGTEEFSLEVLGGGRAGLYACECILL